MKKNTLTDEELDQLLYEYMPKANMLLEKLEEERDKDLPPHVFSRRYERNMKKIIKEYSRTPFQKRLAKLRKYAVAILIFLILTNGILITTVQGYRQRVFKIITNVYEKFTSIITEVEEPLDVEDIELDFIEPSYIPDGFGVINDIQTKITRKIDYMKDNQIIAFVQGTIASEEIKIDTEGTSIEKMEVNNQIIKYFLNKEMYNAYWNDEKYTYSIMGEVSFEEFTRIIEGVIKK